MVIVDQLYGAVVLPEWLKPLFVAPELQRLREIRLINTSSPSCPALSDVRRFTHTIGVMHLLATVQPRLFAHFSESEVRHLQVASLLHDIGTPPFGHLFEYQLAATKGWHHEDFVLKILRGVYRPEKRYHQIYFGRSLSLYECLSKLNLDVDYISDLISGKTPLGMVLAGTIDIDNIDNVFRMSSMLGFSPDISGAVSLAKAMLPNENGISFSDTALPYIKQWQVERERCYRVLAFDEGCLSGQAMLTECITSCIRNDYLSDEHWFFTDEQLLRYLAESPDNKHIIQRFVVGDFFDQLFIGWYSIPKGLDDLRKPECREQLAQRLSEHVKLPCYPYVFYDTGTFSKRLDLNVDRGIDGITSIQIGERSGSTIISVFTPNRILQPDKKRLRTKCIEVLEGFGFGPDLLTVIPDKQELYGISVQGQLPF